MNNELLWIYEAIGNNELRITDAVLNRISELGPKDLFLTSTEGTEGTEEGCGCGHPDECWDCAAIRGGCPEDA